MIIRKAAKKDFEGLKKLKQEFYDWECKHDSRSDPDYIGIASRLARNLGQKDTIFYVAEQQGKLIGYAGAEIKKNPAWVKYRKRGHLFNLYIKKPYRNKGIGSKLCRKVFSWFAQNNIKDIMIMRYSFNTNARKLYKKFGFMDYIIEMTR